MPRTAAAIDSAVVHVAGTETITGAKTFSTAPVLASLSGLLKGGEEALSLANQFIDENDVIEVETGDAPPRCAVVGGASLCVLSCMNEETCPEGQVGAVDCSRDHWRGAVVAMLARSGPLRLSTR